MRVTYRLKSVIQSNRKSTDQEIVQLTRLAGVAFPVWCQSRQGFLQSSWSSVYVGIPKK